MNNYGSYTAQTQAQKGFKTFIFTLSISLIVFSVIYYFISESQAVTQTEGKNEKNSVQIMSSPISQDANQDTKKEDSPFSQLAEARVATAQRAVLAGATTSPTTTTVPRETTATVPQTGTTEVTIGLSISAIAFMFGMWIISKNPRKLALHAFEKKMLDE